MAKRKVRPDQRALKDDIQNAYLAVEKHALSKLESTPADQALENGELVTKPGNLWYKGMKPVNPEGRRATMQRYIYELMTLARGYAPEMFAVLRRIALNPLVGPEHRIRAAEAVLDRAFGPPNVAFQILQQNHSGPQVNVQVNSPRVVESQETELARFAEIARVLDQSGALRAIGALNPRQAEPVTIPVESSSSKDESVSTEVDVTDESSSSQSSGQATSNFGQKNTP